MKRHKKLEINDQWIDNSLQFMLESPMRLFHAIDRMMLQLDPGGGNISTEDIIEINFLKRALLEINEYNNLHLFKKILKEMKIDEKVNLKIEGNDSDNLEKMMYSFYDKIKVGEINFTHKSGA